MSCNRTWLPALVLWSVGLVRLGAADDASGYWPSWRGPTGNGVAPSGNPPVRWSETENVRWKAAIPGLGTSTPVLWDEQVFVLTAVPAGKTPDGQAVAATGAPPTTKPTELYDFQVLALDRRTGAVRWQTRACQEVPHEGHHGDHGFASASPVTDGQHLVVSFGSRGVYGFDLMGNRLWEKRLGLMQTRLGWGEGSSPALHANTVIIVWDHEGDDFIVALDVASGKELWRQARNEPTGWNTPLIVERDGKAEVLVNGTQRIRDYDLATGEMLWECGGMTINPIPSPVAGSGIAYFTSGFRGSALVAVRLGSKGDVTNTDAVVWRRQGNTPYVPSPLLYGDLLYLLAVNNAVLSCFDANTGSVCFEGQKLPEMKGVYASPVGAADRVYLAGREGKTVVIRHGRSFEVLACNPLDEQFDASPAVAGDELYLRGHRYVYCIAAPPTP